MVAQVAAEEPDTAAKMPQPITFTCTRRPGSHCSQGDRPRNISSDRRVRNRISPIQMNSGSAASVHEALALHTVVASTAADRHAGSEQHGDEADQPQRDRDPHAAGENDDERPEQDQRQIDQADVVHQPPPPEAMRSTNSSGEDGGSFS